MQTVGRIRYCIGPVCFSFLIFSHRSFAFLLSLQIVGRTSSWIDPDTADHTLSTSSCAALQQQLSWAAFLGLQAVLLPPPKQLQSHFNYAQVINQVSRVL